MGTPILSREFELSGAAVQPMHSAACGTSKGLESSHLNFQYLDVLDECPCRSYPEQYVSAI
jgi:hypothetical protein